MRTVKTVLVCGLLLASAAGAFAQSVGPSGNDGALGSGHVILHIDSMSVQHKSFATDESGLFLGLEGYAYAGRGWYLGGGFGGGGELTLFAPDEASFSAFEINAKRQFVLAPQVTGFLGGGVSYGRVDFHHDNILIANDAYDIVEWVFGGQVLGSIDVRFGPLFAGMSMKYQLTADADEVAARVSPDQGWDYSNFRIGVEAGFLFGG